MKKIKETLSGGFYIFESKAAANSNYIEKISEAKLLLIYANYFLKDYLVIYDYLITKDGWQMAVKLKSSSEILSAQGDEKVDFPDETMIWRIISERIRLFISTYAKKANYLRGRQGSFVRNSYEKYYFQTLKEAKSHLGLMRNQLVKMYQRKPKYRGLKSHYCIPKKLGQGSIFLCSKDIKKLKYDRGIKMELPVFIGLEDFVVPELVRFTKNQHHSNNHPSKHPIQIPKTSPNLLKTSQKTDLIS